MTKDTCANCRFSYIHDWDITKFRPKYEEDDSVPMTWWRWLFVGPAYKELPNIISGTWCRLEPKHIEVSPSNFCRHHKPKEPVDAD